ncbi:conserved exported hypothetical protein [Rubrivivax sp. A210]|uniref:DUF6701 domain-containing protein n=1 Tax=Rubrivivax sp. A210 TaxID=2772301 RepID=UPI001917E0FA|nr:DUF6701 domain-containing protein [Rubrivivax sp. A210]CAD5370283.1 conserved exported hypothetical protein [Rubrivivax sp. A210]
MRAAARHCCAALLRRLALVGLLCALPLSAAAATVTRTPAASSNCSSLSTGGTRIWSNPTRAWANDNSNATVSVDGTISRYLQCLNYGFSIPAGAAINGITVTVNRRSNRTTNGGSRDALMRIVKGGAVGASDRATATTYTTTEVAEAHGGSTDLWGETWTAADINAADFGAAFAATKPSIAGFSHTVSVDLIAITVDYTVDTTPPAVASIVRASLNPSSGSTVAWTVTFSEAVTGVDASDFALANSGLSSMAITSVSGSGTTWTVASSTGTGSGSLGLNLVDNDSIVDLSGNKLGGTGTGGAANGSRTGEVYTVDRNNPNATAINRSGASPTNAASLSWAVTFNESVTGVDAGDFALVATGSATGTLASVTGSGANWTVTASAVGGAGTLGLNLVDNDSIVDSLLNKLGGAGAGNGSQTGQVYAVDRVAPVVASISRDSASPSTQNTLRWTVTFSKSVTGVDASDFSLAASGLAGAALTGVSGSGSTWAVSADPGYGSGTLGLNLVDDDSIADAVGNPLGGTGAGNGNHSGPAYTVTTVPLASYHLDESLWNGTTDEVADEQGSYPGTAQNGATTAALTAALAGASGTCRYGVFQNVGTPSVTQGYLDLGAGFPYFGSNSFTITAWVRSTANNVGKQWIFSHNSGGRGYALALGTPGPGRLRFLSGGATTPNLDTPNSAASLLANGTWYFVAAVADFAGDPNIERRVYVFDSSGNLLPGYPASLTSTGWDDTETGIASIGGDGNDSFRGVLDEVQIFDKALNQAALSTLAQARHLCGNVVPDHYELVLPSASLACLPSTVTVTACADTSSPCSNAFVGAAGSTVTLSTSAGSLGATTLSLDASGSASTTLSHGSAADGATVSVTLGGEALTASNARRCCANGVSCSAANSCSTTFSTAGFIVATTSGLAATIPAQTAGTDSLPYLLRAVKTGTTTEACEAALTGATTVDWAAQCNNPSTCASGNRMTLTGSAATAIAANPGSGVSSRTAVNMVFDASGGAPFSFNYADVGQVTLSASKTVNGATLAGSSNAFVVKPAGFAISAVQQAASPNLANPGAVSAAGAKFVKAGEAFGATVTARTSSGATAPNFGRETSPEGVLLTPTLVLPAGGTAGTLANATVAGGSFAAGVATVANLAYSEVGIVTLTPSVADGSYLGAGAVSGTASGNVGRFVPARFALAATSVTHRAGLACTPAASATHLGENFTLGFTLTAQSLAGATTQNYLGSFARLDPAAAAGYNLVGLGASTAFTVASGRLAVGSASGSWVNGVAAVTLTANATRATAPDGPFVAAFGIAPVDADGVAMAAFDMAGTAGGALDRSRVATVNLRFGRLRLGNATGAADRPLALPVTAQYWSGSAWDTDTLDSCTTVPVAAVSLGNLRRTLSAADAAPTAAIALAAGIGSLRLAAPGGGRSGTVDVALSLGSTATDASCLQSWTPVRVASAGANLDYLRGGWCGSGQDKDTAARASFGLPRTQGHLLHRRESF